MRFGFACGLFLLLAAWGWVRDENARQRPALPVTLVAGGGKPAIDPVKVNGPIFEDWPKPDLALVFSGELDGYLEPCGCAGLENQKGGFKRRMFLMEQLRKQGWPLASFDVGGLSKRVGVQAEIKFRYAAESLAAMQYDAVAIGAHDLELSGDGLGVALLNLDPAANPFTSANVSLPDYGNELMNEYRVIAAAGKRIGVTAVLGPEHCAKIPPGGEIVVKDPAQALAAVAPKLNAEKCDLQVLLVHGTPQEAADLARQFPQFQYVATAGGAEEPPARAGAIEGSKSQLIDAGHKGMYVIVLGLYFRDPENPVRYQRVPLDARFGDAAEMQKKLADYQSELETMGLAGLGLTGTSHPDGKFVGSATCADCHTTATEIFEATPHAHATDTLVKIDPPRHYDPECLSCHVTGWNPQQYYPYASGYFGLTETPELVGQGCENCHGPGAAHVAAESGEVDATDEQIAALRAGMRLKLVENEGNKEGQALGPTVKMCMECHDLDNSPDFDFQEYWPSVAHEGKD
ncbi:MAG: hypothetical protein KF688_13765 [Pirellulales bacterium]|nr:hypothetical protein [Pirellulales bacterium]